ncbi:MFS transporter [Catellatospora sp. TT07R-123]|uniref:MFS transporter n=1 Tax=Catellatospora sp. TT07R-123 TaxID=2733863 RepID=UPI001B0E9678|nr:MFS transporter [Catellatospora sp. TT07R-123]GHJ44192.1 MFS transporter [Catellatospora sp. TT07R-123]
MTGHLQPSRRWAALAVLCLGNYLILLDTSIVNTAAPVLMRTLDAGVGEILWVFNGYLLALASLLVLLSRLGDLLGPRRVFLGGLALFAAASLLCGLSQTAGQLIAARVLQGIGAAALLPQCLVLITAIFPPDRRGAAFGIFTAVAGVAAVSGPTLGGLVVTHVSWSWIFFGNVPLALGGIVAARRLVPDLRTPPPAGYDIPGVLLATLGLLALVYGLIEGERHHWGRIAGPLSIPAVLAAGVVLLVLFVLWERKQADPVLPPGLLRDPEFGAATAITFVTSFALHGFLLVFVLLTQLVHDMSPLESGLTALPWTLTLSAVAPVAGRLADRIGTRWLLTVGLAVFAAGVAGTGLLPTRDWTGLSYVWVLIGVGLGMGLVIAPTTTQAMRAVTPRLAATASGTLNTARQVGGAVGLAAVGAIVQHRFAEVARVEAEARSGELSVPGRQALESAMATAADGGALVGGRPAVAPAGLGGAEADRLRTVLHDAAASGFLAAARPALVVVAVLLALAAVLALVMRQSKPPAAPVVPVPVPKGRKGTREEDRPTRVKR